MVVEAKEACDKACQLIRDHVTKAISTLSGRGETKLHVRSVHHPPVTFQPTSVQTVAKFTIEDLEECGLIKELKGDGFHIIKQDQAAVGYYNTSSGRLNHYAPILTIAWGKKAPKKLESKPTWWQSFWS